MMRLDGDDRQIIFKKRVGGLRRDWQAGWLPGLPRQGLFLSASVWSSSHVEQEVRELGRELLGTE